MSVRAKKFLGQHFLKEPRIAEKIVEALEVGDGRAPAVLEIGPGMGVLTQYLLQRKVDLHVVEIDRESVAYLQTHYPALEGRIHSEDFLAMDVGRIFPGHYRIIGNFPYNISSQIFFKVLETPDNVDEVICMLQKEVADRICAPHGSKTYGILSVLLQAYYHAESLFKVSPGVFNPPPKVMSSVIRLRRNERSDLGCKQETFHHVVKQAFQKRRKTLRNALKHLNLPGAVQALPLMDKRPEQLSVEDFLQLTRMIEAGENVRNI